MDAQTADDSELIRRVAAQRDQAAFQKLYERYAQPAYNLALYLTRNPAEAEDAVQNAFVNVWRFAGKYRSSGTPRGWLLRIVANAAMREKRSRRAREVPIETMDAGLFAPRAAGPERAELHAALLRSIDELPEATRQMIALYYGANCTQGEIGEMLELPQTTVSMRLREAVQKLRTNLAGAGLAAVVPLLESDVLGDVLLAGKPVPPSLAPKVFVRLAKAAAVTRRSVPLSGGAAAAAALALAAAGAWLLMPSGKTPARGPAKAGLATGTETKAAAPERIHGKWRFAEGQPEGFHVFGGACEWVPAEGGLPAGMRAMDMKSKSGLSIPLEVPAHRCWEVRIRAYVPPDSTALALQAALGAKQPRVKSSLFLESFAPLKTGGPVEGVNYVQDDENWNSVTFYDRTRNERMGTAVTRFDEPYERIPYLLVSVMGVVVTEIEVREVTREEIPMPYRDFERLVKAFNLKPDARKTDRHSPESGEPHAEK